MTVVCIHQPDFLPWLGFFDRLKKSDIFVVLDNVQFIRRGWHNRDKIKTANGVMWLTVPVKKKGNYKALIKDIEIDNTQNWKKKHLLSFKTWYSKAKYFFKYYPYIESIYIENWKFLWEFNLNLIKLFIKFFNIDTEIILASSLDVKGRKTDLLIDILKKINGKFYITGLGSKSYLEEEKFHKHGIKIIWQEFKHPIYKQLYGQFIGGLSAIDYLFNCGHIF